VEQWIATDIHDVDDNAVVKFDVVPQGKAKTFWGLAVFLAEVVILRKMFKCLLVSIVASSVENSLKSLYRRVSESAVDTL
jgi:hypothetical protein